MQRHRSIFVRHGFGGVVCEGRVLKFGVVVQSAFRFDSDSDIDFAN